MSSRRAFPIASSFQIIASAKSVSSAPWPTSPNMMPKSAGKSTTAKTPGLTSRYLGTPYVSTSAWKAAVTLPHGMYVGGVSPVGTELRIALVSPPALRAAHASASRSSGSASRAIQPSATKTCRRWSKLHMLSAARGRREAGRRGRERG